MISLRIVQATTDDELRGCFPVIRQLRPHLTEPQFVAQARRQSGDGYRIACAHLDGVVVAVAGFRVAENLAWGKFLYVDDLVTSELHRSKGYGRAVLNWLRERAAEEGCQQLHLDSGVQRADAHRFYEREGMQRVSYHYAEVNPGR